MAVYLTEVVTDLAMPPQQRPIPHQFAMGDNNAYTITALLCDSRNPEAELLDGTVGGELVRPDGVTVALEGEKGDAVRQVNLAAGGLCNATPCSVTLPQACFAVPGRVTLTIKLTEGTTITQALSVSAVVVRTSTDEAVDPGEVIPDLAAIQAAADEALEAAEAATAAADHAVQYDAAQSLTDAQKAQARENIVAADAKTVGALHSLADYGSTETEASVTTAGITATKAGTKIKLNGANATYTARFRMTGALKGVQTDVSSNSDNNGTTVLKAGHIYRIEVRLISGTIASGSELIPNVYRSGTKGFYANTFYGDTSVDHFDRYVWGDGTTAVTFWFSATKGSSLTKAVFEYLLEDVTAEMLNEAAVAGCKAIKASEYDLVLQSIDSTGELVPGENTARYSTRTLIPADCIYSIQTPSTLDVTVYAFGPDMTPLGFWDGSSAFNTGSVTYLGSGKGFLMAKLPARDSVGFLRLSIKRHSGSTPFSAPSDTDDMIIVGKRPDWHKNLIWYAIGDSITYGTYSYGSGSIARDPLGSYAYLASKRLGYKLNNVAVPNLGFTVDATDTSFTYRTLPDVLTNTAFTNAALVTVMLGTNDYGRDGTLGTIADTSSTNSVYGRAKLIIETLQTKCPGARLIFITPIPRETSGNANSRYCMTADNNNGFSLGDVKTAIVEICTYYGIEYINWSDACPINYYNHTTYQADSLHPTVAGHYLLAGDFAAKVIS